MEKYLQSTFEEYIHISRYARWSDESGRRETWPETVKRYCDFFNKRFDGKFSDVIYKEVMPAILNCEVMPSMRALMTAGEALERENIAGYNCSYLAMNSKRSFSEMLYILLCGTGAGFSCERQEIAKLPSVPSSFNKTQDVIVVEDSKLGWAKGFNRLLNALWDGDIPKIDYSKVRPAGARLKTFGGRASGPEPLRHLFDYSIGLFKRSAGRKLNSLEVHDLSCVIGEIVVVGGVRRSALISLSNLSDQRLRDAKSGQWWHDHPERALSNNSIAYTEKPEIEIFMEEWLSLVKSKSGERGIFNRVAAQKQAAKWGRDSNVNYGCNPCCVVGDTLILTSTGHIPISSVIGQSIEVWNGHKFSEVTPFSVGVHPTVNVELSSGAVIQCTLNHKFVLAGGSRNQQEGERVEASNLSVGDKLAKFDMPVIESGSTYSVDAYSQGFYSGDGNIDLNHSLLYAPKYMREPRLIGRVGDVQNAVDRKTWIHGSMLEKNFVPITGSLDYCLNWLAGILDSDGSVTRDENGNGFQITSIDKKFLDDVRIMLTRLGVCSNIQPMHGEQTRSFKEDEPEYHCKKVYRLMVGNMSAYKLGELGLKTERLEWHKEKPQRDAARFVTVVSVTPATDAETYCFDEPENHTGTFNGIVTGQSEIILRDKQMCNLSEVVVRKEDDLESLKRKARIATILGTFQSTLSDFKFISEQWTKNTEEERLLGVSMTGVLDNELMAGLKGIDELRKVLNEIRDYTTEVNLEWSEKLGIQKSASITCVKPSGTVSVLVNSASGLHTRHSEYYIRTVRTDKKDPLYNFMKDQGVYCEDDVMKPGTGAVFSFPIKAPEGCLTRDSLTAIEHLDLWMLYQREYCHHKPSITVSVKDYEWMDVGAWVWKNFDEVSGVSFLPHSDHTYQQAPYQQITKEDYERWLIEHPALVIDWTELEKYEKEDSTVASQTLACSAAGGCEI